MDKNKNNDPNEKRFAEQAWLNYFNHFLFEEGTISEKEYKRMTEKIAEYTGRTAQQQMQ